MSRRDDLKARAQSRNARRAAENAAASVAILDPNDSLRAKIRAARHDRIEAERRRVRKLQEPHRDPGPDETVQMLQFRAEAQRRNAAALGEKIKMGGTAGRVGRRERKEYLKQARLLDIEAANARVAQLASHRIGMAAAEIERQAKARGESMEDVTTEVHDWVRDEHGAYVPDDYGVPKLGVEISNARRQKHGLRWALDKGKISPEQSKIGWRASAIWSAAAQAAEPGRAEESGLPLTRACKASPGPADWRLEAMQTAKEMEAAITSYLPGEQGAKTVTACRKVCYEGRTVQSLAEGDKYEQIRIEERLKLALALIRYWLHCSPAKEIAA